MGIDAIVWARDEGDDRSEELEERLRALGRSDLHLRRHWGRMGDEFVVEWAEGVRYWDIGYERGPWLLISSVIEAFRAVYSEVHYNGDSWDAWTPVTDERMAELWAHWRSPHWQDWYARTADYRKPHDAEQGSA